jgi:hypothetical protein
MVLDFCFPMCFELSYFLIVLSQVLEFNDGIEKLLNNSLVFNALDCHYWLVFVASEKGIFGTYVD